MPKQKDNCAHCGNEFYHWPSSSAKFCNRACWRAANASTFDIKAWHEANREDQNRKKNQWRIENREKRLAIQRKWRISNKEKVAANGGMRRAAIKAGASREAVSAILEAADGYCTYCGERADRLELDHVCAIHQGGKHDLDNLLPACRSCNAKKSAKDAAEWLHETHGISGLARAVYMLENRQRLAL